MGLNKAENIYVKNTVFKRACLVRGIFIFLLCGCDKEYTGKKIISIEYQKIKIKLMNEYKIISDLTAMSA